MVQVRFNTNYGVLPNQKRWRVLIDGSQLFTDSVDIRTKSWTTKDIVKGDDGKDVEKFHVTCNPDIITTNEDGILLTDFEPKNSNLPPIEGKHINDLVCIKWSVSQNSWKVGDKFYDNIVFDTDLWTSDISPELCCRPKNIGESVLNLPIFKISTLYLPSDSNTFRFKNNL